MLLKLANVLRNIDARFDVIGAPYSLLSVTLSASQNLYTRRGTLVGLSGKADSVRIDLFVCVCYNCSYTVLLTIEILLSSGGFNIAYS